MSNTALGTAVEWYLLLVRVSCDCNCLARQLLLHIGIVQTRCQHDFYAYKYHQRRRNRVPSSSLSHGAVICLTIAWWIQGASGAHQIPLTTIIGWSMISEIHLCGEEPR